MSGENTNPEGTEQTTNVGNSTPVNQTTPPAEQTTPPAEQTTPPAEQTTPPASTENLEQLQENGPAHYELIVSTPLPESEVELTKHKNRVAKAFEGKDLRTLVHRHNNQFGQWRTADFLKVLDAIQNVKIHFEEILVEIEKANAEEEEAEQENA